VLPLPTDGNGMSECQDVHTEKLLIASDEIVAHEGVVIDVALASRCGGAIECGDRCGVLNDCLQDVRFAILAMLYLFALLLDFYFSLASC
jgi:hypothetical protein